MPSPGKLTYVRVPSGPFLRDDSGVYAGYEVPRFYDPMISKLSVWAPTRPQAIARMRRALSEYVVKGITTNTRYLLAILDHPEFQAGDYDTGFLGRAHEALLGGGGADLHKVALLASAVRAFERDQQRAQTLPTRASTTGSAWRQGLRSRPLR
jgi:acetyl-CoA carboxylase biotin carboxylase subunit